MQMTPPSATQLITVRRSDKDMMKSIEELLKVGGWWVLLRLGLEC